MRHSIANNVSSDIHTIKTTNTIRTKKDPYKGDLSSQMVNPGVRNLGRRRDLERRDDLRQRNPAAKPQAQPIHILCGWPAH